ncbi:MAG: GNAT family N-acetyltransferase, partial [Gammaproteobacteria bacterium]|nr:GNAT family N-acetyltransferase [Gammaproteobacteria bacterium]
EPAGNPILAYYTLTYGAIAFASIPSALSKGLPKYPIPIARIAELAVDCAHQGLGLGSDLLLDALIRITRAAEKVAIWAILVDPIDQHASAFYLHHGFQPLRDSEAMILTLKDAKAWVMGSA